MHWPRVRGLCSVSWCLAEGQFNGDQCRLWAVRLGKDFTVTLFTHITNMYIGVGEQLTNKDISLIVRGRLYSSYVQSSMLHGSETWPVRKENEVQR